MKQFSHLFRYMTTAVLLWGCLSSSLSAQDVDSVSVGKTRKSWISRFIDSFSEVDTNYVEPQHYNWSLMLQGAYDFEFYRMRTTNESLEQVMTFSPDPLVKVGPYFGYRWIFLGYNLDLKNLRFGGGSDNKSFLSELDLSVYSSRFGFDLFYRHTSDDYKIKELKLGTGVDARLMTGQPFNGMKVTMTGANLYYIFNHKRFSYPAAFAQSTCQKVSCGSWMAGIGYLSNSIDFDYRKLERQIAATYPDESVKLDSGLMFNRVQYYDIDISGGYAYNWVFARNWLLTASLSLALAHKGSSGDSDQQQHQKFSFNHINIDGVGRFALVWNNVRWYAGANAILRTYSYRTSRFSTNNIIGNIYLFAGYNFGLRKQYKKKKP